MTTNLRDITVTWKREAPDGTETISGEVLERVLAYASIVAPGSKIFQNFESVRYSVETQLEGLAAICWGLSEHEPERADLNTRAIFWTLGDLIQNAHATLAATRGLTEATVMLTNGNVRDLRRPEGA
jgi:hypothetical protein